MRSTGRVRSTRTTAMACYQKRNYVGECVSVASPLQRPPITSLRKNLGGRLTAPALNDFSLVCDLQEDYE